VAVNEPPRRPPRVPRPGDPFARGGPAPAAPAPPKRRKKGRNFFLVLLLTGGVLAIGSLIFFYNFKGMAVHFYEDVVVPRGIPEALPPGYPRADAERLVRTLSDFFKRADAGAVSDDRVLQVISAIESAMADQAITPEEAEGLIRAASPASPAATPAPGGGADG
jgi:hypothetical protein